MLTFPVRTLSLLGPLCGMAMAQAQTDTTAYGGPESAEDEFLALDAGHVDARADIEEAAHALGLVWDVNDSLARIPGYDIYCHWNTDRLFTHRDGVHLGSDTLMLHLAHEECDMAMPSPGHVTSPFGPRKGRMHQGVDLKLRTGDPVVTAFDGMVRISRYNKSYGHVVVVRHFNGLETLYAHLSKRHVKPGDLLHAGDTLGLGGNTGRSYGSHLHFEVRFLDQPIDPAEIFDLENGTLKARTFDIHKGTFAAIAKAKADMAARKYHTVRSGDTLSAISRRYGRSVAQLCRLNGIRSTSILRIGQRVRYN
ncbi:MAG: M23 family metallopeptidase [Flavobacteriales bacterium]|jgi:murein DD-endopeptidase MepM/ murein hydrolase activator NlpD|nr:M23 family metallopeptidase [Flavobacteriales bacterium]